jgi:hypothetical protein
LPSPEAEPMAADAEEGEMLGAKSHHPAADVAGEPMLGVEKGGLILPSPCCLLATSCSSKSTFTRFGAYMIFIFVTS